MCGTTPRPGQHRAKHGLGVAAVQAGRARYFTASELVETPYRGLADNSVGKLIDTLLRNDLIICDEVGFAPLDDTGPNCCSGSSPPPTNAAHSVSPATGRLSPGAGSCPNTPPRSASSTGSCTTPTSSSPTGSPTGCAKPERREAPPRNDADQPARGGDFYLATGGDRNLAIDSSQSSRGYRRSNLTPPTRRQKPQLPRNRRKTVTRPVPDEQPHHRVSPGSGQTRPLTRPALIGAALRLAA